MTPIVIGNLNSRWLRYASSAVSTMQSTARWYMDAMSR